jgi:hypothetical protein
MALDSVIRGSVSGSGAEVTTTNRLKVELETNAATNPGNVGGVRNFSENDTGYVLGTPSLMSPEVDSDFRIRTANDTLLDDETFNYTTQNTGKHAYGNTTLAFAWTAGSLTTNSANITTTTTGGNVTTYAMFPILGTQTLACDAELSFSQQPTANTTIDFGMFLRNGTNPYNPTDGAYFRLTAAGLQGVVNYNGTETNTGTFKQSFGGADWTYVNNKKYQFILYITTRSVQFWINDAGDVQMYGEIETPEGQGTPCMSSALPFTIRHAIVGGAAGAVINAQLSRYNIRQGGSNVVSTLGELSNRVYGSYQGLSGGTMGGLTTYTNSTNPAAAVPSNTALTANLPSGLGGQAWETFTSGLALNTDGILMSYQVPAGTVNIAGKRLKITGVKMSSFVQTAITGGPFVSTFALAFGHTAVSLATAECAATKKPRIILLPELTQSVAAAAAAGTMTSQPGSAMCLFPEPIYVNPSEFVAFTVKHIGTAATAGVIGYNIQYVYSWE